MKNKIEKKNKILIIILALIVLVFSIIYAYIYLEDFRATKTGIIMKVNNNSLSIMEKDTKNLYSVSFAKERIIGFKQGQEVLIYFDGMIAESYPAQIHKVGKIKIVKERTDIQIPEDILRYYNSSKNNVSVSISDFNTKELSLVIKDTNEYKYNYSNDYRVFKKIKNKDYTGIGYVIGQETENSTPAYTGTGPKYIWEEINKIQDTVSNDRIVLENIEKDTFKIIYNFKNIFGELISGEYYFLLTIGDLGFSSIRIDFKVDEKGIILYNEPIKE